jgi:RNA polymerase sigma-70 factor (ECF subfamily)
MLALTYDDIGVYRRLFGVIVTVEPFPDNVVELRASHSAVTLDDIKQDYEKGFNRYFAYAYTLSHSQDIAKDIVQNVFAKLVAKVKGRGPLKVDNIEAYIIRSIRNDYLDRKARKANNEVFLEVAPDIEHFDSHQSNDDYDLAEVISQLSSLQRTCLVMHYYDHLKIEEIAHELSISTSAVKTHIQRARQNIANKISAIKGGEA